MFHITSLYNLRNLMLTILQIRSILIKLVPILEITKSTHYSILRHKNMTIHTDKTSKRPSLVKCPSSHTTARTIRHTAIQQLKHNTPYKTR